MAFEWNDLVDGEDYVTAEPINNLAHEVVRMSQESDGENENTIDIGSVPIYVYSDGLQNSADATDTITFKPTMAASYADCFKPMSFRAEELGSGEGDGYVFYNDYVYWDYHSLSFELYFHTFTKTGEMKVVKLVYEYDDYETSPPRSITAYLVETPTIGDIETALDGIIAIQEALIGGDSV